MTEGNRALLITYLKTLIHDINAIDDKETRKELKKTAVSIVELHNKSGILNQKEVEEIVRGGR